MLPLKKMYRAIVVALAGAACAVAQEAPNLFNAAPPGVEAALRERVSGFYQAYVDGKFRQAEQFVAEDTKDLHYNQEKTKIRGFEIVKINFDDHFKKASVVTTVQTTIQMRGNNIPAAAPMATRWKLENGQWSYYVDPNMGRETPMGVMKPGPGKSPGIKIDELINNPSAILSQVKLSKQKVLLKSWEKSSDEIIVSNGMPGSITIVFRPEPMDGLTTKVERFELASGETSRIEFHFEPKDPSAKPQRKAALTIQPFGRTVEIPVVFDIPEEIKKQIPK